MPFQPSHTHTILAPRHVAPNILFVVCLFGGMFESKIKLRARGGQASYGDKARGGVERVRNECEECLCRLWHVLGDQKYVGDVRDETERSTTRGVGP